MNALHIWLSVCAISGAMAVFLALNPPYPIF
ncbi:Uncharacterised protein [uncultured Comamonas sp.]|nr:Uncharacterised protein [uncultured Comamonas sp.]